MGPRKCAYTNKPATTKDAVIPKKDEEILHNWANRVPADSAYLKDKHGRLPTELEMQAAKLFYMLELAKLDVSYLEMRLKETQDAIASNKQDEVEKAYHVKELTESFEESAQEILNKTKTEMWE